MHATCYHVRGYPLVEQMRADVAAGALGELTFVHGRYLCDDVLFPASGWRDRPGALRARRTSSATSARTGSISPSTSRASTSPRCWPSSARSRAARSRTTRRCSSASTAAPPARSCSRPAPPAGRTSCSSSCEGTKAGLTWDQELPTEMRLPPGRRARRRSSSRTRRRTPRARAPSVALPGRPRRGLRRRLPEPLRRRLRGDRRASRTRRSRPSATATAASRRVEAAVAERADGGWVEVAPRDDAAGAARRAASLRSGDRQQERERDQQQRRREQQASRARSPRA